MLIMKFFCGSELHSTQRNKDENFVDKGWYEYVKEKSSGNVMR